MIVFLLLQHEKEWGIYLLSEMCTKVSATRYRVPDISVLRADVPREKITNQPPLIATEILSPEARWSRMQTRIGDFLAMGVENIWIFDPEERKAGSADRAGLHLAQDDELTVPEAPIRVVPSELFGQLKQ